MQKDSSREVLLPAAVPAPPTTSSKLPSFQNIYLICEEMLCCTITLALVIFLALFVCMCIILDKTNNIEVRTQCAGFWEFMLVALLSPVIIPTIYCMYMCLFLFVWAWRWKFFSGICMLVMGICSLHMAISVSENQKCIGALEKSTPPLPWLLYAAWVKCIFFFCGSISLLYDMRVPYLHDTNHIV